MRFSSRVLQLLASIHFTVVLGSSKVRAWYAIEARFDGECLFKDSHTTFSCTFIYTRVVRGETFAVYIISIWRIACRRCPESTFIEYNAGMKKPVDFSLVLACYNEEPVFEESVGRIIEALSLSRLSYEIICVDDKSSDKTPDLIQKVCAKYPHTKAL